MVDGNATPERAATQLVGWRHIHSGQFWKLQPGHKEPDYTVDERWKRVYAEHYEVRNV